MAKHALCARRATDIAHANEKYLGHHAGKCAGKPAIRQAFFASKRGEQDKMPYQKFTFKSMNWNEKSRPSPSLSGKNLRKI
jgi:hypothetical protein